jgi:D-lactate dehydrogenase
MKVAFFSSKSYDREYFNRANQEAGHWFAYFETSLDSHTIKLAKGHDAVCVFVNDQVDAGVLKKMKKYGIGLLALRCAGFNNVDLKVAEKYGIRVLRVPAYSPEAVAEHALALIFALNRKTHKAYNRVREGNFSLERLIGFTISGKTAGVVGTGAIGRAFIRLLSGFNVKIKAYDLFPDATLKEQGVDYVSFKELLAESDIVSLHCPLTHETYRMINADSLKHIKAGAMLINTSRGKLIDTEAAIDALRAKRLGSLGIDVYAEEENLFYKDLSEMIIDDETISRLIALPNVLITAHQAFLTHEALEQIAETTLRNFRDFENGTVSKNEVTVKNLRAG